MTDVPRSYPVRTTEPPIDMVSDAAAFACKFYDVPEKPRSLPYDLLRLRIRIEKEETKEYEDAALSAQISLEPNFPDIPGENMGNYLADMLDATIDQLYATLVKARLQFPESVIREAWRRVHTANMQKVRADTAAQSVRQLSGDVIKPSGWERPDHRDLVQDHMHRIEDG